MIADGKLREESRRKEFEVAKIVLKVVTKHTCICYQQICNRWPDLKLSGRFQTHPCQHTYMYTHFL